VRESPARSTRRRWTRRRERPGPSPQPAAGTAPQGPGSEQTILSVHDEAGQSVGAYETRYDIRRGYGEDRTIIQP